MCLCTKLFGMARPESGMAKHADPFGFRTLKAFSLHLNTPVEFTLGQGFLHPIPVIAKILGALGGSAPNWCLIGSSSRVISCLNLGDQVHIVALPARCLVSPTSCEDLQSVQKSFHTLPQSNERERESLTSSICGPCELLHALSFLYARIAAAWSAEIATWNAQFCMLFSIQQRWTGWMNSRWTDLEIWSTCSTWELARSRFLPQCRQKASVESSSICHLVFGSCFLYLFVRYWHGKIKHIWHYINLW